MMLARNRKFEDSPLEGNGFELPVPGFKSSIFLHRSGAWSRNGAPSHSRVLTTNNGRFTVRRARLAPAMISTPGHRASRRRQREALPAWRDFLESRFDLTRSNPPTSASRKGSRDKCTMRACCVAGIGVHSRQFARDLADIFGGEIGMIECDRAIDQVIAVDCSMLRLSPLTEPAAPVGGSQSRSCSSAARYRDGELPPPEAKNPTTSAVKNVSRALVRPCHSPASVVEDGIDPRFEKIPRALPTAAIWRGANRNRVRSAGQELWIAFWPGMRAGY